MKKIFLAFSLFVVGFANTGSASNYHSSIKTICDKTAEFKAGLCMKPDEVKEYLIFAKAAYADTREKYLKILADKGWTYKEIGSIGGIGAGLVAFKDKKVIVAYHGTESAVDWAINLNAKSQTASEFGLTGNMHQGFYAGSIASWGRFKDAILQHIKKEKIKPEDVEYFAIGHSLGGAIASVAGLRIAKDEDLTGSTKSKKDNNQVKVITVGQPRVFMKSKSAAGYEALLGSHNVLRFWNSGDPVSAVPLGTHGFKHVGTSIRLSDYESVLDEVKTLGVKQLLSHFMKKHLVFAYENDISSVFESYQKKPITHKGIVKFAEKCAKDICKWAWSKAKKVVGK